jgi:hypothetical protein
MLCLNSTTQPESCDLSVRRLLTLERHGRALRTAQLAPPSDSSRGREIRVFFTRPLVRVERTRTQQSPGQRTPPRAQLGSARLLGDCSAFAGVRLLDGQDRFPTIEDRQPQPAGFRAATPGPFRRRLVATRALALLPRHELCIHRLDAFTDVHQALVREVLDENERGRAPGPGSR